jgi:hypothetical protein
MGTRSLTFVYEENKPVVNMYRQFDGYPSGHGQELADFLLSGELVNGYSETKTLQFNGMGCLAAQLIVNFKKTVGGFYIYPVESNNCWQDYEYHVYEDTVVVKNPDQVIFNGSWQDFRKFCYDKVTD